MDALVLSCGTGGGHDSAGRAITEELKRRGHNAQMLNPYSLQSQQLAHRINRIYTRTVQKMPGFFGGVYGVGEFYRNLPFHSPVYFANHGMVSAMQKYFDGHPCDMVISSHLFPAEILTNMKHCGLAVPKTMFVATDYTCIPFTEETECDAYIIPSESLTVAYEQRGIPREKVYPIGIPVHRSFSKAESREAARQRLGLERDKQYILITGGSMGGGKIGETIETFINGIPSARQTELIIICGSNRELYEKLTAAAYPGVTVVGYTDDMAGYLKSADIFVTKPGGLSSTEAAVCGVPILHTAAIPGCETYNARYFHESGMSESCETPEEALQKALTLLNDEGTCTSMIQRQKKRIEPFAAEKICQLAENICSASIQ